MIMMLFAVFRLTTLNDILYIWGQILSLELNMLAELWKDYATEMVRVWDRVSRGMSVNINDEVSWANTLALSLLVVFFMPNTLQLFNVEEDSDESTQRLTWWNALIVGALGAWAIILVLSSTAKEFIYFAF
jgi:hypothetical protein